MLPHSPTRTRKWADEFPGRIGEFCGLETALSTKPGVPYVLDNGKFAVWSSGKEWDEQRFIELLNKANSKENKPEWVIVPDVVTDPAATLKEWDRWYYAIKEFGFNLALAVQDGMTPKTVKAMKLKPDVIFIGGSKKWKWRYLKTWTAAFPRVHVGRATTGKHLWMVHRAGAESSDGTGWFLNNPTTGPNVKQLRRYLTRSDAGLNETDTKGLLK